MIAYLDGTVECRLNDGFIVNVNGVGYRVTTSTNTLSKFKISDQIRIFTYLHLREDIMQLYGFSEEEEQEVFEYLISVSKIGPKIAISVLSSYKPAQILNYIAGNDISALSAVSGVGKKMAERIVLELKEKIGEVSFGEDGYGSQSTTGEAMSALMALGYSEIEARNALSETGATSTAEEAIKKALVLLAK